MPTTPTQMRLTESDKAKAEQIRERMGLPSLAAVVRYALDRAHREMTGAAPRPTKKSGKGT